MPVILFKVDSDARSHAQNVSYRGKRRPNDA
jgi:hypothetical protein